MQEFDEARPLLDAASRATRAAGFHALEIFALGVQAAVEFDTENRAQAEVLASRARELLRRPELEQNAYSRMAHIVVGKMLAEQGELNEAAAQIERGIHLNDLSQWWDSTTYGLLALAEIRHRQHKSAEARRLRARAIIEALRKAGPGVLARVERAERTLRLRPSRDRDATAPYWELSERELAVLRLLGSKLSQREIAAELYVSFNTVKTHMRAIFRKLGVASRAEAVERARELGFL
jgi:LuxR family maltose regulon positive regulatory protein